MTAKQSRGLLLPFAAILLVGIAILGLAISDIASQSSEAAIIEGVSVQAFYAAESGAYYGINQVVFDVNDRATADANCAALNGEVLNFTANGLQLCSSQVFCSLNTVVGEPKHFYIIRSSASCGAGDIFAQRSVEVSTFL